MNEKPLVSLIRDNHRRGNVGDFLKSVIQDDALLSVVSAYFTIYAYAQLRDKLENINHLHFLFGEPTFIKSIDPSKTNRRNFSIVDDRLVIPISSRLEQKPLARDCADWIKRKVSIKSMVKPNFLHGKMYHILQKNGIEKAVVGSSNFTVNGLGLGGSNNIELNLLVDSERDRTDLKQWFDDLWCDESGMVEDVKDKVLEYLAQLYVDNEPEFIYYKTLYHIFAEYLDEQNKGGLLTEKTGFLESEIWNMLYDFQKDGVRGAINKILKHNGCVIADSVGLGKTFEGLAVIRYFESLNCRVLVLCPKKLAANWTIYQSSQNHVLNPFKKDKFNYTVLHHTDLSREIGRSEANGIDLEHFNWGAFDLVVIDESHNFRGNPMERVTDNGKTKLNRAKWLMDKIIREGVKTKVLLLTATPVNNNLRDLRNQMALITEGHDDALLETTQIRDIGLTLKNAQTQFTNWADRKKNPQRTVKQLLERLDSSFFKLLDELTIARSRKHIQSFYKLDAFGAFPERLKPISIYPNIDLEDRFFTYDALNKKILQYKLSVFNPSAYVKKDQQKKYEEMAGTQVLAFKQKDRENFLIGMMKINFLKRLESSIESFEISMDKTIKKIETLDKKIRDFLASRPKSEEVTLDIFEPGEDELEEQSDEVEQWQVGKKLKFDLADLELDRWLADLEKDKEALVQLYNYATAITPDRDAKIHELKTLIRSKIGQPFNGSNRKVIVFTAFADTAKYLYDCLEPWVTSDLRLHTALVTGTMTRTTLGKNDFSHILANFSPISKNRSRLPSMPQSEEIDIVIATDCISEGQNLQDCDYLINYDIHWNPVRIIQRFGRIDRLGSVNESIQLVNFWPTKDLDNYINLKERVEARMALVDVTATAEDNILATDQIEELIADDLKYRNQQLKKLKDVVLDLEEMEDNVTLTDFTLDDFRIELMKFLENNREKLEQAPTGLFAVVPSPTGPHSVLLDLDRFSETEREIVKPGIVFCLKHQAESSQHTEVNPLHPHFLVYMREDGTARFTYVNAKQILEIFRKLCQGRTEPYRELCALFDDETRQGSDMGKYSDLLAAAIRATGHVFHKKNTQRLTTDRSALIVPASEEARTPEQFELISWLVIR